MLKELETELNWTHTENGALAYYGTQNACLDLFAAAGALRSADESRIERMFQLAYAENPDDAMRILFYLRDVRGGLGERRLFRVLLQFAAFRYPESVKKNLEYIPEYGRFDDCLVLLNTPCEAALVSMIQNQLNTDTQDMQSGKPVSLLAKWLPSVNTSSSAVREQAKQLCRLLRLSEKAYRKTLSQLRTYLDVLEKRLCARDYTFDYEALPSKALYQYQKAFRKHDGIRYESFLKRVQAGKAELKAKNIFPYEIIQRCMYPHTKEERRTLDLTWKSLPDYTDNRNAIAVVDGSASMYWREQGHVAPITVAVSLGLYFAERSQGYFRDYFITFSDNPRLIKVKGKDIVRKAEYCMGYNECANTNLERVFELLLYTAVHHHLPQEELPEIIYIISDMEFDDQTETDKTIFQWMQLEYQKAGYQLPLVVYWNVCNRNQQYPVRKDETGAILVSGCNPVVFRSAMDLNMTPEKYMRDVLDGKRYCGIMA